MNDQVILSVTKRGGGLEVTTRGTGHDQLAAIEAVAASAWRVMTANRNVPPWVPILLRQTNRAPL